ncbi:histidine--tRNA ligase [Candidatus Saccharibacteria bacterium]|nr:histidine--tRNA ligase [Candidatus Saccharibacteria bacterium]
MKVQTLKGFRDITPPEALKRGRVLSLVKSVFKSYGFTPLETPTIEYLEVLEGKYGQEGEKLMYRFKDRGGRDVALRYDFTVPLARYIAQNSGKITFPFKRYQIGSVFRAEKPQAGRYREFTQVDVDTVGIDSTLADAEILAVFATALAVLGVKKFTIKVNDRDIFKTLPKKAVRILDKLDKIGEAGAKKELEKAGFDAQNTLREIKKAKPTKRIEEIFALLDEYGIDRKLVEFTPTLARGLDYYTGVIFEIITPTSRGAIAGGGRYDEMIGMFLPAGRQSSGTRIPAVGCSFGLDRLIEVVPTKTLEEIPFEPQVLVTIFSKELTGKSIELFDQVQATGTEVELYLDPNEKLEKQLKYADRKGITYALILGPEEAKADSVTVKDLKKGTQRTVTTQNLINLLSAPAP